MNIAHNHIDSLELIKSIISAQKENSIITKEITNSIISKEDNILSYVSNDAIFATFTSIIVFTLGIIATLVLNHCRKKRKAKDTRNFVKHHLDQITELYSSKLVTAYKKLSEDTTIDTGIFLTPPKILSNDFQRILHIDSKELFQAIKEKETLSKIIGGIDFIDQLLSEVQQYHDAVLSNTNILRDKINNSMDEYFNLVADFLDFERQHTPEYKSTEPYIAINNSTMEYHKGVEDSNKLQWFYDKILRPNQELLVENEIYLTSKIAKSIVFQGKNLSKLINRLKDITKEFKDQYTEFATLIEKSTQSIQENVNKINW